MLRRNITKHRQRGMTLLELMITVGVLGVILAVITSSTNTVLGLQKMAQRDRDQFHNMQVGRAMLDYAGERVTNPGTLPAQTASPFKVPTSDNELLNAYYGRGLSESLAKTDGTQRNNDRVYRRIEKTRDVPLFGSTGPAISLRYQEGAIFMLSEADAVLGGPNAAVRSGNFVDAIGTDVSAYRFSTLSLQKSMLRTTSRRLERLRQSISDYAATRMTTEPAVGVTSRNYLPGEGLPGVASGAGCNEVWLNLATSPALTEVGLSTAEYGVTAWGNPIQYCRNYGPGDPDVPPFYGAIRLQKNVFNGSGPWVTLTL